MIKWATMVWAFLASSNLLAQAPEAEPAMGALVEAFEPITVEINEWTVPWPDTRPRDPDVAPNGSVWLVGQGGDYVAHFDPESQEFSRKSLPPGTGPHNLIVDRDARLWIAGNRLGFIGRMSPNSDQLTRFPMPEETIKDPHTMVFSGRDHIWFTAQWSNYIGRMNKRSGQVEGVFLPIDRARPYGIKLDSSGRPWIALLGANGLATVNPETLELEIIRTPQAETRLRRIAITSDDAIWYTDYNQGYLGRYVPASGAFTEWKNPSEQSGPYAIASDDQDRIWFVETWPEPNMFVGFDPVSETFFSLTAVPSGAGAVRHMVFDARTNSVWFGTDTNHLGQALLPPPGVPGLPPKVSEEPVEEASGAADTGQ
jgi:virginiamycin B lyase